MAPVPPRMPAPLRAKLPELTASVPVHAPDAAVRAAEPAPILVMPVGTAAEPMAPVKLSCPVPAVFTVRPKAPSRPPERLSVEPVSTPIPEADPKVRALETVLVPLTLRRPPPVSMP